MDLTAFQDAPTYLQLTVAAVLTALIVEFAKLWLRRQQEAWWYDGTIPLIAFAAATIVSLLAREANLIDVDAPIAALILMQSVMVGALASGGYKWVTNIWGLVGGAITTVKETRQNTNYDQPGQTIGTQFNIGEVEGDVSANDD